MTEKDIQSYGYFTLGMSIQSLSTVASQRQKSMKSGFSISAMYPVTSSVETSACLASHELGAIEHEWYAISYY